MVVRPHIIVVNRSRQVLLQQKKLADSAANKLHCLWKDIAKYFRTQVNYYYSSFYSFKREKMEIKEALSIFFTTQLL